MRLPFLPVLILFAVGLIIDFFIFSTIRRSRVPKLARWYAAAAAITLSALGLVWVLPKGNLSDAELRAVMWLLYGYLSVYVMQLAFSLFELFRLALSKMLRRPLRGLTYGGIAFGGLLFILMWWGALINRYNLQVREVEVEIADLPEAFKDYRIVQLSDIHCGSFDGDTTFLSQMVDRVLSLKPDLIVFTGDLVNRHAPEMIPYTSVLGRLHAPDGVYGVMGNHDFGDYYSWDTADGQSRDISQFCDLAAGMGWKLLNNSYVWLRSDSDSIALVGVQNVGDPPFKVRGSLPEAYPTPGDSCVKILLSHNPAHWVGDIAENPAHNVALTLSGHTHAMQIELAGITPGALRYPTWGGLYTDSLGRKLYVNIGIGEVGMPARIGATPEITLLILK